MIDSGSKGCPEQESAGCHFGTLERNFLRAKTKWPPNISRSNMIFQLMEPGTSVIPHFYVILTGQSISCIILMKYLKNLYAEIVRGRGHAISFNI